MLTNTDLEARCHWDHGLFDVNKHWLGSKMSLGPRTVWCWQTLTWKQDVTGTTDCLMLTNTDLEARCHWDHGLFDVDKHWLGSKMSLGPWTVGCWQTLTWKQHVTGTMDCLMLTNTDLEARCHWDLVNCLMLTNTDLEARCHWDHGLFDVDKHWLGSKMSLRPRTVWCWQPMTWKQDVTGTTDCLMLTDTDLEARCHWDHGLFDADKHWLGSKMSLGPWTVWCWQTLTWKQDVTGTTDCLMLTNTDLEARCHWDHGLFDVDKHWLGSKMSLGPRTVWCWQPMTWKQDVTGTMDCLMLTDTDLEARCHWDHGLFDADKHWLGSKMSLRPRTVWCWQTLTWKQDVTGTTDCLMLTNTDLEARCHWDHGLFDADKHWLGSKMSLGPRTVWCWQTLTWKQDVTGTTDCLMLTNTDLEARCHWDHGLFDADKHWLGSKMSLGPRTVWCWQTPTWKQDVTGTMDCLMLTNTDLEARCHWDHGLFDADKHWLGSKMSLGPVSSQLPSLMFY